MGKPARFSQLELDRAYKAAAKAGLSVAVLIQADGSLAIVPADKLSITVTANDLDARIAKFGGK